MKAVEGAPCVRNLPPGCIMACDGIGNAMGGRNIRQETHENGKHGIWDVKDQGPSLGGWAQSIGVKAKLCSVLRD